MHQSDKEIKVHSPLNRMLNNSFHESQNMSAVFQETEGMGQGHAFGERNKTGDRKRHR